MFVEPRQYLKSVHEILKSEGPLSIAVAFWGEGADKLIEGVGGRSTRIICNLRSGGTNPAVIAKLRELSETLPDLQVSQSDHLHAKVLIGKGIGLVGSANLSINGLGFEGPEAAHWLEAGIMTKEPAEVQSAQAWFDRLWKSNAVRPITDKDLSLAAAAYSKNRSNRADYSKSGPFSFDNYSEDDLKGRDAFALLYRSRPGKEAIARAAEYQAEQLAKVGGDAGTAESPERWEFESWPSKLDVTSKNEYLCLYWTSRGTVRVDGACRFTDTTLPFKYRTGARGWVDLAKPEHTMLGRRLIAADCKRLASTLKDHIETIWKVAEVLDDDARRIPLHTLKAVLDGAVD